MRTLIEALPGTLVLGQVPLARFLARELGMAVDGVSDEELAHRRAKQDARGKLGWKPAKIRNRRVSAALQAYAAMTTSADRGAVRDVSQLKH